MSESQPRVANPACLARLDNVLKIEPSESFNMQLEKLVMLALVMCTFDEFWAKCFAGWVSHCGVLLAHGTYLYP